MTGLLCNGAALFFASKMLNPEQDGFRGTTLGGTILNKTSSP